LVLKKQQTILEDQSLARLLMEEAHPRVADVLLKWDEAN